MKRFADWHVQKLWKFLGLDSVKFPNSTNNYRFDLNMESDSVAVGHLQWPFCSTKAAGSRMVMMMTTTTKMMIVLEISEAHPRCQATYTLAPVEAVLSKILYFLHSSWDNTYTHVTVRSCTCLCRQVIQANLARKGQLRQARKSPSFKLGRTCV